MWNTRSMILYFLKTEFGYLDFLKGQTRGQSIMSEKIDFTKYTTDKGKSEYFTVYLNDC